MKASTLLHRRLHRALLSAVLMVCPPLYLGASSGPAPLGNEHVVVVAAGTEDILVITAGGGDAARSAEAPTRLFLDQNYPNPFNPSTMIRFGLPGASNVRMTIHTLLGNQIRVVVDGWHDAGTYVANIAVHDLPSGVYFYRLETDFGTLTRRMTIAK